MTSPIEQILEGMRKRLINMDRRNPLIHVNRKGKRVNALHIINERSDDIFDLLQRQNKKMHFRATAVEEEEEEHQDDIRFEAIEDEDFDEARYRDKYLETPLTADALQKRLLKLARDARTAEEEQGVNILYLNLGFLRWYKDANSDVLFESPLILLPVELVRNKRTSSFDIQCREEDIETNLSLQEYLKNDFGMSLPDIADNETWTPEEYFDHIEDMISNQPRWSIDRNGMILRFFSFANLLMIRDLEGKKWQRKPLIENLMIKGLLRDGFSQESPLFGAEDNLDERIEPSEMIHVTDADASQTKVIEEARKGRNLVVEGPPGTGKSQTIINILSAAVYDGKKVLFVAEKMAALDVVYRRMKDIGMEDICLELHSRKANKKAFLYKLGDTLENKRYSQNVPDNTAADLKKTRDALNHWRKILHTPVEGIEPTPFDVLSRLIGLLGKKAPPPKVDLSAMINISSQEEEEILRDLDDYCRSLSKLGSENEHPFRGTTKLDLQPTDIEILVEDLQEACKAIDTWNEFHDSLSVRLKHPFRNNSLEDTEKLCRIADRLKASPKDIEPLLQCCYNNAHDWEFHKALEIAAIWVDTKTELSKSLIEGCWSLEESDFEPLKESISAGCHSWWSRILPFGAYRSASKKLKMFLKIPLPKAPHERLEYTEKIIDALGKKNAYMKQGQVLEDRFQNLWQGERSAFKEAAAGISWLCGDEYLLLEYSADALGDLIKNSDFSDFKKEDFLPIRTYIEETVARVSYMLGIEDLDQNNLFRIDLTFWRARFVQMVNEKDKHRDWAWFDNAKKKLTTKKLEYFLNFAVSCSDIEIIEKVIEKVEDEFLYGLNDKRWKHMLRHSSELQKIRDIKLHALVEQFQNLEKNRFKQVQQIIRFRHFNQIPELHPELKLINHEIKKKRAHRSIRYMMNHAGSAVQKIKPVFLMSPISVAQFLPPERLEFDLLVIDEASQVKPEHALGSLARAKQIIVVGDQNQLPPTSFFDRMIGNEDDNDEEEESDIPIIDAGESESILSLCEAQGFNQRMLEWHYRSRDPSLITVSNREFYKNRLILPPSTIQSYADEDGAYGMNLKMISGAYTSRSHGSGRTATNHIEAEAIADQLCTYAAKSNFEYSVGVVTFSATQADMITEILDRRRVDNPTLDQFLEENKHEYVFIKSIENVQGDERDIILISVCYGPYDPGGRLASMNFGLINKEHGERRLNVLFTRAKTLCRIYCSFNYNDIDPHKGKNKGPRILRSFLKYAQTRQIEETYSTGDPDSEFEEEVAKVIRSLGFEVDHQVKSEGFKIDLGVKSRHDSGQYILAVECDGATYHGSLSARERDRHRQEILEDRGWHFHRIWSTDWFYRRTDEIDRLELALELAEEKARKNNIPKPSDTHTHEQPMNAVEGTERDFY